MHKRLFLCALASAAPLLATPALAQSADGWPARSIRWVVPFPPGGAMDAIARSLGDVLAREHGQAVVIDNRPGAGGNIGADFVAKQPADGYTMMITSIGMATNPFLYRKLGYDPVKDFTPVSVLAVVPNVLVANAAHSQARSVKDVLAAAKAQPGKLTYASAGSGTSIHLAAEMFTSLGNVQMTHVPYKGSGPAVADLLGGQVDYMFDSITSAGPHIRSGKLRALAVTTARRSPALPDVPTVAEAGLPGYEVSPWFAVFVPAGTPPAIVARLHASLLKAMQQPEVKTRFAAIGAEPIGLGPQESADYLARETARWGQLIKARGIRLD